MSARAAFFPFLSSLLLATLGALVFWPSAARSQGDSSVPVDAGWNNVTYQGDPLETSAALNDIEDETRSVWRWRSQDRNWENWTNGGVAFLNSLATLQRGDVLWLFLGAPATWTQIGASQAGGAACIAGTWTGMACST